MVPSSEASNETVFEFKNWLKATLNDANYSHKLAKPDQSARPSLKYKPHFYKTGDK